MAQFMVILLPSGAPLGADIWCFLPPQTSLKGLQFLGGPYCKSRFSFSGLHHVVLESITSISWNLRDDRHEVERLAQKAKLENHEPSDDIITKKTQNWRKKPSKTGDLLALATASPMQKIRNFIEQTSPNTAVSGAAELNSPVMFEEDDDALGQNLSYRNQELGSMATCHQTEQKPLLRADAIRSRLIDTFSLIEHLQGLSQAVPRHTIREIIDPTRQRNIALGDQDQLVRFSIKPHRVERITYSQRLLSRLTVRCSKRPPISLWAGWVLECRLFTNFIISLILLNTVVLMIEIELDGETSWHVKLVLEGASWFILLIFLAEIIIKWLFSFHLFWKSAWNVFDFIVTILALLPELIVLGGGTGQRLQLLRICRVLRSLKFLARFPQIRVIILALVRALKSMTFLWMLLLIFFYIFAVAGVHFFEYYTRSTRSDLKYHMYFSNVQNSFISVFILFTMDHWYELLQDTWKVPEVSRLFSSIYIILWIILGAIVFRNIIVAMMVNNFQTIRNELNEEMAHLEVQQKADLFKRQIIQRRQNLAPEVAKSVSSKLEARLGDLFDPVGHLDWETHVHQNLPGLMDMDQEECVVWPRDSLFQYFELLEELQYNLEERKQLQEFAVRALMNLEDK
ncbi:cation channel sperm-associated protein 2 [Suncus etruscus]|uniref:cation channel sperm-associated protein 2 n=1 Tax=Suncus etruscus TaxID=109475 RepID=UPI002110A2B1|nr:cation channel sperm-associated protein 2 [Suncus etruscus]